MKQSPFSAAGTFIRVLAIAAFLYVISLQAFAPREIEIHSYVWLLLAAFFLGAEGGEDLPAIIRAFLGRRHE